MGPQTFPPSAGSAMATATVEGSWVSSVGRTEIIGKRQHRDKELEARLTGEKYSKEHRERGQLYVVRGGTEIPYIPSFGRGDEIRPSALYQHVKHGGCLLSGTGCI